MATRGANGGGTTQERITSFREFVTALNKQFVEWVQKQCADSPDRFWSSGLHDYLRHQAKIRREFADVIEDDSAASRDQQQTLASGLQGVRPVKYEPMLQLMPFCNTKVVHFIRHGEGFHNAGLINLDAHLTVRGWDQAHALGRHMHSQHPTNGVQLVVVSPLTRALETAAGVFGVELAAEGGQENPSILMQQQSGEHNVRIAHAAVALRPGVRFVAHEGCRERLGPSVCDKRRPISYSSERFPGVDFGLVKNDEDTVWETGHVEPESAVVVRGARFMAWLMQRPETNIAVVTHSAFLWFTLTCFGNEYSKPVREGLQRWYENCEMRTVVLGDGGGAGVPDTTWFLGGEAYNDPQKGLLKGAPP